MPLYRLMRSEGVLVFNAFPAAESVPSETFWVARQAAAQGGGSMYQQITMEQFENLWSSRQSVEGTAEWFRRSWDGASERAKEDEHRLCEAIDVHRDRLRSTSGTVRSTIDLPD